MAGIWSEHFGHIDPNRPLFDVAVPLVTHSMLPVVAVQALWLLRRRGAILPEPEGPTAGVHPGTGPGLRVLFVGDSSVVGVGTPHTDQAIGASFARAWASRTGQAVHWHLHGRYGATTREIEQDVVPGIPPEPFDRVVLSAGTNDIMRGTSGPRFEHDFVALIQRIRNTVGLTPIQVCQLPPIWSFPSLPQPLRTWAWIRRQQLDWHQQQACSAFQDIVRFAGIDEADPGLFASDGFHPGPSGYTYWGEGLCSVALEP